MSFAVLMVLVAVVQEPSDRPPPSIARLEECTTIREADARLACFDARFAELRGARETGEIVVLDRQGLSQTQRELFGFQATGLFRLFADTQQPLSEIETALTRARRGQEGQWIFELSDGAVWRQVGVETVVFRNEAGQPVRIRRASLGSYLMTIGDSRAVRVRRQ